VRVPLTLSLLALAVPVWADPTSDFDTPAFAALAVQPSVHNRIVVMGDSIQAGTILVRSTNQATYRTQHYGKVIVHNFPSPGATMADKVPHFLGMQHAVEAMDLLYGFFGMQGLVINLGTNDWDLFTVSKFDSAYGAFLDALPVHLKVACMSPTWSTSEGVLNSHGETKADYRAATKALCEARGLPYLNGLDAIPNNPAYFVDGLHPNDRGHKFMGNYLVKQVELLGWLG